MLLGTFKLPDASPAFERVAGSAQHKLLGQFSRQGRVRRRVSQTGDSSQPTKRMSAKIGNHRIYSAPIVEA